MQEFDDEAFTRCIYKVICLKVQVLKVLIIAIFMAVLCGCIAPTSPQNITTPMPPLPVNGTQNPPSGMASAYGHVYLDNTTVDGAVVEAISDDGMDRRSTVTDNNGSYVLDITPNVTYKITATAGGLRHAVWPVFLPGDINIYDIHLATTSYSAIDGVGYMYGGLSPGTYNHTPGAGFVMEVKSVEDNKNITSITDAEGRYSMEVEPGVLYNLTGDISVNMRYPIAMFHYRNDAPGLVGYRDKPQVRVEQNETVLIDYTVPVP